MKSHIVQPRPGLIDDLNRRVQLLESAGAGLDFPELTDLTGLQAWYAADNDANTIAAGFPDTLTTAADLSGNGVTTSPVSTTKRWKNMLNNQPFFDLAGNANAWSSIAVPVVNAMTFFAVIKPISNGTFQNLYADVAVNGLTAYWDHTGPRYQLGTTANSSNSSYGVGASPTGWKTVLIFHFNSGSNPQATLRENGVQLYTGAAGTAGAAIPSSTQTIVLFKNAALPWQSYVAEFGFYSINKAGSFTELENYLRQKYNTW